MAITVDSLTEKKLEELAKSLGRSELSILKDAVRHYADECKDMDDEMARLHDPHAHLIDHEEAKRVLSNGIMA
jgi:predicted transcriptional regulator